MTRSIAALFAALTLVASPLARAGEPAPAELRLWPGKAPGSESWSFPESVTRSPTGDRIIRNVSDPTLTVFLPAAEKATGAAVVIAPGGALRLLSFDNEGVKVARWLNERGIAAFLLKYRTLQAREEPRFTPPPAAAERAPRAELVIRNGNANPEPDNAALTEVLALAMNDARAAMRLVRANASAWRVDPHRVGLMGFSAGGGVAVGVAMGERNDATPDFLVSLYGPSLMDVRLTADAPPLFIAVGTQHFNVASGCLALAGEWRAAGRPVELHLYDGVSAGFGMTARGLPVDGWTQRFHEWLMARGLVPR
jgi:acetyl esterase/lipase